MFTLKVSAVNVPEPGCNLQGTIRLPYLDGDCVSIEMDNGDTLLPVSGVPEDMLIDGLQVKLSYIADSTSNTLCYFGIPAEIICIHSMDTISSDTIPGDSCSVFFAYTKLRCSPDTVFRCYGNMYQFKIMTDRAVEECTWHFGDGGSSNDTCPVYQYEDSGLFVVCLQVKFQDGCYASYCDSLWVGQQTKCKAQFDYHPLVYLINSPEDSSYNPVDSTISMNCIFPPDSILLSYYFADQSVGNVISWIWEIDSNEYYTQNVTHNFQNPGIYNVCLHISTADSCESTLCKDVYIGVEPECHAAFQYQYINSDSIQGPDSNVASNYIQFYDYSWSNVNSWYWNFGDSTYSYQQNPAHYFMNPGVYYVCLTITTNNGCTESFCQSVIINSAGNCEARFEYCGYSETDSSLYSNDYIIGFKDKSQGSLYSWYWDFGDGAYSYEQNPVHKYSNAGIYTVCLQVYGTNCQDSYCKQIQVGTSCNLEFTWNILLSDCEGYYPAYEFSITNNTWLTGYYWDFGDGSYSYESNPLHVFESYGQFTVCLHSNDSSGCSGKTCQVIDNSFDIVDSVHLKNCGTTLTEIIKDQNELVVKEVYPVPVQNEIIFNIETSRNKDVQIDIIDITGVVRHISKVETVSGESEYKVDVSDLPAGQYIYKIHSDNKVEHGYIIKE